MPKLQLLILDAGVVIKLHELGLWNKVIERCVALAAGSMVFNILRLFASDCRNKGLGT